MKREEIAMSTSQNSSINSPRSPPIILMPKDFSSTAKQSTKTNFGQMVSSNLQAIKNEVKDIFTFEPKQWLNAFRWNPKFPLFVLGDIDGFVALFMNNLATLLAVILGLKNFFSDDLIYGKIVPG